MPDVRRKECHLDEDDPKGRYQADELDGLIKTAHPPRGMRLAKLGITDEVRQASREPPAGYQWIVMLEEGEYKVGDVLELGDRDSIVG